MTSTARTIVSSEDAAVERYGEEGARRLAYAGRWRTGDLSYHCSAIQRRARALVYRTRRPVLLTNRRFGKSRTACVIAAEHALRYPGVWIPYAAGTKVQVERFVHPHLRVIASHAPPDIAPEEVQGEWRFPPLQWLDAEGRPVDSYVDGGVEVVRFRGSAVEEKLRTSIIVPVGCEDRKKADRLRGPGTVFAVVDEAGQNAVLEYVVGDIIGPMLWEARSRWGEKCHKGLLATGTPPEEPDHPYARMVAEAEARGALLTATVYDCDHLDARDIAEAIEDAGGEDTSRWRREGLAIVEPDPEWTVLPEFTAGARVIVAEHERPKRYLPHVIGDAGFEDMGVLLFGYYDFKADVDVIEAELVTQRTRSDLLDAEVARTERELWGTPAGPPPKVHRRHVDAQPQVRADMSREEWQAETEGDAVRRWQGVSKPSGRRAGGSMRAGANAARVRLARGRVRVHPSCTTTIAHCKAARWDTARWDTARDSFERVRDEKGRVLHHYDGAAALVYFLRDLDRAVKPYPALPEGVSEETHYINPALLAKRTAADRVFFGNHKRR